MKPLNYLSTALLVLAVSGLGASGDEQAQPRPGATNATPEMPVNLNTAALEEALLSLDIKTRQTLALERYPLKAYCGAACRSTTPRWFCVIFSAPAIYAIDVERR